MPQASPKSAEIPYTAKYSHFHGAGEMSDLLSSINEIITSTSDFVD